MATLRRRKGTLLTVVGLVVILGLPATNTHEPEVTIVQPTEWVQHPEIFVSNPSRREHSRSVGPQPDSSGVKETADQAANGQILTLDKSTTREALAQQLGTDQTNVKALDDRTFLIAADVDTATLDAHHESNAVYKALIRPNDASFGNQIGLSNVSATDAWDIETGHHTVRIAVVDTGVNGLHEDLFGKVIEGYDFVNDRPISRNSDSDDNGHGTAVASVAAAYGNNTVGISGMAWGAEVMPIKVLNSFGFGYTREVVLGVQYAIDHDADIIVMSIGSTENSPLLEQKITDAWDRDILLVAAAGNDGPTDVYYPAKFDKALAVGASDGQDIRASFSNAGLSLDMVAPGVDIMHASGSDSGYQVSSGTSFAAPFVAGAAALIKSRHPAVTTQQLHNALRDTADNVAGMNGAERTDFYGFGRLNAAKALRAIEGTYRGEHVSHTENIPPLGSTQSWQVEFQYRNTGTSVWRNTGPYRMELATARASDHIMPFTREDLVTRRPSGWLTDNRMSMVDSEVRPGGIGTFRFWISIPSGMTAQMFTESVQLNIRDVGAISDTISSFDVRVLSELDRYHAAWDGQSPNRTLSAGQSSQFLVRLKNVGNATWTPSTVRLGTARDQDRISRFLREGGTPSGWISPTRITLQESAVAPGQVGTFVFYMKIPTDTPAGTYREYFQPVAQDLGWMEDLGIYWDITVQ